MQDKRDRREYRETNRDAYRKRGRKWYKKNKAAILARQKAKYKANPAHWRDKNLRSRHGVTLVEVEAMMAQQGHCCANSFCRVTFGKGPTKPCLDHDHKTNKVRGILCNRCNIALGFCEDNAAKIRGLAEYLETHTETT